MAKRPKKNDAIHTDLGVAQSNNSTDDSPNGGVKEARVKLGFPVVGIVASAGGLEAFKSFFSAMPNQCGMAFVLVPHLDAKHKSMMVELLSRQTTMPVVEAMEGMIIEADSRHCLHHPSKPLSHHVPRQLAPKRLARTYRSSNSYRLLP